MKLPGVSYGGVQSLGRTSPGLAASVEIAKGQVGQAVAQTVGATADHISLLQEQNKASELFNQSQDEQLALSQAINQKTGMVDINQIPDIARTSYMTGDSGQMNDVIIGNQRLVPIHKVAAGLIKGLEASEEKRTSSITTRRGRQLYDQREKGKTKAYAQQLSSMAQNSIINETTNNELEAAAKSAASGDPQGVVDAVTMLTSAGYLSSAQGKAIQKQLFTEIRKKVTTDLDDIISGAGDSAFKGSKIEVANSRRAMQATLDNMNEFDGVIDEKFTKEVIKKFDINVGTQESLSEVESIYFNQGDAAAQAYLTKIERAGAKEGFSQTEQDQMIDKVITRYHRLSGRDKAGRAASDKQLLTEIRNYETARSNNFGVQTDQAADLYVRTQDDPALQKRLQIADRVAIFSGSSHADQVDSLRQYTSGDLATIPEAKGMMASFIKRRQELEKDALGYAIKQQVIIEIPFDPDNPLESMQAIKEQSDIAGEFYQYDMPLLTKANIDTLNRSWPSMSEGSQASFIQGLASMGDDAIPTLAQISKNNGGMLAALGGNAIQGRDVNNALYGQKLIESIPGLIPEKAEMVLDINNEKQFAAAFGQNAEHLRAMQDVVLANYAGLTKGVIGDFDDDLLEQAIAMSTNGILNVENGRNDSSVIEAPRPGMTEDDVKAGINSLLPVQIEQLGGVSGLTSQQALEVIQERGTLQSIGMGRYLILIGGESLERADRRGEPFILDWDIIPQLVMP